MLKKPLFWEMVIFFSVVLALHIVATIFHLYWSINEFDSLVHFFAGAALSMFFLWLYFFSGFFNPPKRSLAKFLIISILGSMFIALSWEIYELILGEVMVQKANYPFDTMMDLIMDFLGAVAACFYGYIYE
jgi:glucan phosphoethanolaminetransferase (alkaline phosphatase superfamily)